jgi:hypothetical protein
VPISSFGGCCEVVGSRHRIITTTFVTLSYPSLVRTRASLLPPSLALSIVAALTTPTPTYTTYLCAGCTLFPCFFYSHFFTLIFVAFTSPPSAQPSTHTICSPGPNKGSYPRSGLRHEQCRPLWNRPSCAAAYIQ